MPNDKSPPEPQTAAQQKPDVVVDSTDLVARLQAGIQWRAEQIEESCQQMLAALEILSTCTGPLKVTHDDREKRH